jgi:hypothetical protein
MQRIIAKIYLPAALSLAGLIVVVQSSSTDGRFAGALFAAGWMTVAAFSILVPGD